MENYILFFSQNIPLYIDPGSASAALCFVLSAKIVMNSYRFYQITEWKTWGS